MREEYEKILKEEFPKTQFAVVVKVFLEEELERLNDVSTIKGDVLEKARILEGRQHAERILTRLMRLLEINKVSTPPKEGTEYR